MTGMWRGRGGCAAGPGGRRDGRGYGCAGPGATPAGRRRRSEHPAAARDRQQRRRRRALPDDDGRARPPFAAAGTHAVARHHPDGGTVRVRDAFGRHGAEAAQPGLRDAALASPDASDLADDDRAILQLVDRPLRDQRRRRRAVGSAGGAMEPVGARRARIAGGSVLDGVRRRERVTRGRACGWTLVAAQGSPIADVVTSDERRALYETGGQWDGSTLSELGRASRRGPTGPPRRRRPARGGAWSPTRSSTRREPRRRTSSWTRASSRATSSRAAAELVRDGRHRSRRAADRRGAQPDAPDLPRTRAASHARRRRGEGAVHADASTAASTTWRCVASSGRRRRACATTWSIPSPEAARTGSSDWLGACPDAPRLRPGRRPSAVSELIFTSGTEAEPKAIMHTEQTTNFAARTVAGVARPRDATTSSGCRRRSGTRPASTTACASRSTTACRSCCRTAGTATERRELVEALALHATRSSRRRSCATSSRRRAAPAPTCPRCGCSAPAARRSRRSSSTPRRRSGSTVLRLYGSTEVARRDLEPPRRRRSRSASRHRRAGARSQSRSRCATTTAGR